MDSTSTSALDILGKARYISLETFKQNGDPVRTPVWTERFGDKLVVWTNTSSYKTKRLRRNPALRAAVCNANGKKILSDWFEGTGKETEDPAFHDQVVAAMRKKYGWQWQLIGLLLRIRGVHKTQTVIELSF
jgi:hypothetical protein